VDWRQTKQLQENTILEGLATLQNVNPKPCEGKFEDSLFMKLRKSKSEEGLVSKATKSRKCQGTKRE
jgi:hypothetical protein